MKIIFLLICNNNSKYSFVLLLPQDRNLVESKKVTTPQANLSVHCVPHTEEA